MRGRTGGTILAIRRGEESIVAPTGHRILRARDIFAVAGAHASVDAVRALLLESDEESEPGQAS